MSLELEYLRSLGINLEGVATERFQPVATLDEFQNLPYSSKVQQIRHLEDKLEAKLQEIGVANTLWLRYLLVKSLSGSFPTLQIIQGWGRKDRTKILKGYRVELPNKQE